MSKKHDQENLFSFSDAPIVHEQKQQQSHKKVFSSVEKELPVNKQSQSIDSDIRKDNHNTRYVALGYPIDKAYSYSVPEGMDVQEGSYVCVPLGKKEAVGVVWPQALAEQNLSKQKTKKERLNKDDGAVKKKTKSSYKVKPISYKYNLPPLPKEHMEFIYKLAAYTLMPLGLALKMTLNVPKALEEKAPIKAYKLAKDIWGNTQEKPEKLLQNLTSQRKKIVELLQDKNALRASEIARQAGCSQGVVKAMAGKGLLEVVEIHSPAPCKDPSLELSGPQLSKDQEKVAQSLKELVRAEQYSTTLIDGVTGAGKTETYFEAVYEALKCNKQVLILLPEIALSNAFLDRFKKRFGCAPALWHSNLSPTQRASAWRGVAQGHTKVVVGARSALFLPYKNLGLIVVDEEHDPAYKQEEGVMYHARDMAVLRAFLGKFPTLLVSATPALETMQNVWSGRYTYLHLPDRYGGAHLPSIHVIDLKEDKPDRQKFISSTLRNAIAQTLDAKEQALLFLNRRGYAPLTICRSCGHRLSCPRCTSWLVEHKQSQKLHCHHCGYSCSLPSSCSECNTQDSFAVCGPGVERIYEEIKQYFPEASITVLASDTAETNDELSKTLRDIKEKKYDIIIGTQIIAKGHHFPHLTCVGIVDADLGLNGGELKAAERTYQLLHQVSGRAGRESKKGHVYLQTYRPEHRIIQALASGDRNSFLQIEAKEREYAHMPPYSRLAGIIVSGREEGLVIEAAKILGKVAPQGEKIQTLGPAPAPFARLRGKYRYRLLVRADKNIDIQKTISLWLSSIKTSSKVRIQVDIDPQSFL